MQENILEQKRREFLSAVKMYSLRPSIWIDRRKKRVYIKHFKNLVKIGMVCTIFQIYILLTDNTENK